MMMKKNLMITCAFLLSLGSMAKAGCEPIFEFKEGSWVEPTRQPFVIINEDPTRWVTIGLKLQGDPDEVAGGGWYNIAPLGSYNLPETDTMKVGLVRQADAKERIAEQGGFALVPAGGRPVMLSGLLAGYAMQQSFIQFHVEYSE